MGATRFTLKASTGLLLAMALAGCGTPRPPGLACNLDKYLEAPGKWAPFEASDDERNLNVLALSAGGELGAYGAGFLAGWAAIPNPQPIHPRSITIVTGVSTGALVATHAFLGRYDEIRKIYESLSGDQIYRENGVFKLLTSNALTDSSGKDALIRGFVNTELVEAVAAEAKARPVRKLLVGTVDIETGEFLKINLSQLAADESNRNREACFEASIGAASAIPLVFSPVFIDGRMLVDGGARHHNFLHSIAPLHMGKDVTRRIFSVYHGEFRMSKSDVSNGLLPIAKRTSTVITDQLIKDTAYRMDYITRFAPENRRFETYFADVHQASKTCAQARAPCKEVGSANKEDMFCRPYMVCLSEEGRKDATRVAGNNSWTRDLMTEYLGSTPE